MGRGRPGGNPDFGSKYAFKTEREEPLSQKITVRITETMDSQLRQLDNYREFVRTAIAKALKEVQSAEELQKLNEKNKNTEVKAS